MEANARCVNRNRTQERPVSATCLPGEWENRAETERLPSGRLLKRRGQNRGYGGPPQPARSPEPMQPTPITSKNGWKPWGFNPEAWCTETPGKFHRGSWTLASDTIAPRPENDPKTGSDSNESDDDHRYPPTKIELGELFEPSFQIIFEPESPEALAEISMVQVKNNPPDIAESSRETPDWTK